MDKSLELELDTLPRTALPAEPADEGPGLLTEPRSPAACPATPAAQPLARSSGTALGNAGDDPPLPSAAPAEAGIMLRRVLNCGRP